MIFIVAQKLEVILYNIIYIILFQIYPLSHKISFLFSRVHFDPFIQILQRSLIISLSLFDHCSSNKVLTFPRLKLNSSVNMILSLEVIFQLKIGHS